MKCSRASESQADRSLEGTSLTALALDRSEWRIPVHIQERARWRRVVENVGRVHSECHLLRLRELERLAHGSIERPVSRKSQRRETKRAAGSRLRILEHDLSIGVGDGLERAEGCQLAGNRRALRIFHSGECRTKVRSEIVVVGVRDAHPVDLTVPWEISDDIRNRVTVQACRTCTYNRGVRVACRDAGRLS